MSWLISQALMNSLCSQEQAAESLAGTCSDGGPSAPSNGSLTPQAYCAPDRIKAFSRLSRFGMTCEPLTEIRGEELLTLYRAGFPAKTYQQPGEAQGSTESGPVCGEKWHGLLAKYDRDSCLWKTPTDLLAEDSVLFSETWPRSGTMRSGCAFRRASVEHPMSGRAYGFLPTPTCHNAKEGAWPAEYTRRTPTLATHAGGKINPEWTEWLMGWPLGWTDLKPSGTDKFHEWRRQHSQCSDSAPDGD